MGMNVERKHTFADQGTRSLRARSNTPTKDLKRAHLYQGERAVKSDLSSMVGPVYNSGKATKHSFTGGAGYTAPKARADQQELVNKFFKRADQMEQVETIKTENRVEVSSKIESKVEFSSGEERRKEALKTRQQLEEERESFFRNTVMRVQEEAAMLSNRAKEDELKRIEYLKSEEERIKREEVLRQEAMLRAEEERKQKELARQEELKRQQLAMAKEREEMERQRLLKLKQEEEERLRLERLRREEEKQKAVVVKSEMSQKSEENSHLEELRRQDELRRLEKQRLEQMIIQESKVVSGQVGKRSDDVSGLGWGNVKTGFVSKKKLGFLQREMSMEREASGSPVPGARARGLRVTFADSPNGSRPGSTLGWAVGSVADMDIRAQTPPLAGEWAVATTKAGSQMASSQNTSNGSSSFAAQKTSSVQSKSFASQQSQSFSSQSQQSFSSVQKSSFSSSQSSSFKSSSIEASQAFEAFLGLGGIENLKIE